MMFTSFWLVVRWRILPARRQRLGGTDRNKDVGKSTGASFRMKGNPAGCALWLGLLAGFMKLQLSPYWFVAAQSLVDAILVIVLFHGDIRIR